MPQESPILDTLLRVMRTLRRSYDRRARDVGLTLSRARALTTLAHHDGITQTELAAELAIEAPTLKRQNKGEGDRRCELPEGGWR